MGYDFNFNCRTGVIQYTVIRIILAFGAFILDYTHKLCEGEFHLNCGYPYLAFFNNASQLVAMYCLALYVTALYDELLPIQAVSKLLCVKAVVFFTFWQSIFVAGLVAIRFVHSNKNYNTEEASKGLENFLICLEMLIASYFHYVYFPVSDGELSHHKSANNNLVIELSTPNGIGNNEASRVNIVKVRPQFQNDEIPANYGVSKVKPITDRQPLLTNNFFT